MSRLLLSLALVSLSSFASPEGGGLIRSIWSCNVPCHVKGTDELISYIHVAYCATSTLSETMIASLSPLCREKTGRPDVVAVRKSAADVATCISSSNTCPKEGITRAGFTCHFICPSEDKVIRKFTACASTAEEAWGNATRFCKDAVAPDPAYMARGHVCVAEGQTGCD